MKSCPMCVKGRGENSNSHAKRHLKPRRTGLFFFQRSTSLLHLCGAIIAVSPAEPQINRVLTLSLMGERT